MFNINDFIMRTIKGMIGFYPDFQVREYALNWYSKGKLAETDILAIDEEIEARYKPVEETVEINYITDEEKEVVIN